MKVVKTILTLIVSGFYIFLLASALMLVSGIASSENLTTDNLVPGMAGFTASGGTSAGTGAGCATGAYCTSGTSGGGGTYTSSFDVPLTEAEVQLGFTLNSAITINSHVSNSRLATCTGGVSQSSDCRDIFKLTVTLADAGTVVETFTHQEELDWTGLQNFAFTDVVATNDYGILTGIYELFGIDAGFSSGFYGPQFSSPSLTLDYQTAFVQAEVLADVEATIATETNEIIQAAAAPPAAPPPPPPMAEPVMTVASFDTTMPTSAAPIDLPPVASAPPVDLPPVMTVADIPAPTNTLSSPSASAAPPPPPPPAAPVIAPIAPVSETQQTQESAAEAQIEAAVEAPTVEASAPEPTVETPTVEPATPEATTEAKTEAAEKPTSKPTSKSTRRKVAVSTTSSVTPVSAPPVSVAAVSVPVTPAMAAQTVVDNIAPSQKYGTAAQTVTLIAMGVIAENRSLFKGPGIPDAGVKFFSNHTLPDGPSIVDKMTNYQFSGQANGLHNALVESQWSK